MRRDSSVMANIREAVELYLETMDVEERKRRLSKEILTTSLERYPQEVCKKERAA
jgi:predicted RNase H-like HicB family nuclease